MIEINGAKRLDSDADQCPCVKEKQENATKPVTTTFTPLHDRILAAASKSETVRGGIIIPDSARKSRRKANHRCWQGQVQRGRQGLPLGRETGDRVLFGKYSGTEIRSTVKIS